MKILQINSGRRLNGAMVHTYLLSRELLRLGHEVHVVSHPEEWLSQQLGGAGIPCYASSMCKQWREVRCVSHYIREQRFDVIHTHMSRAHMFGILLSWSTGVPCVATAHGTSLQLHWRWNHFVIANSESTRRFHIRYNRVLPEKIRTVYCTPDLEKFLQVQRNRQTRLAGRNQLGVADDQPLLGVIGEVTQRKGHLYLFRALPYVLRHYPGAKLVVIGPCNDRWRYVRSLRKLLQQQRIDQHVIWAGQRSDIPACMAALDICVVPSIEEPLGLVAIEAQAAGTPLIVSSAGGLPEVVTHQQDGIIVKAREPLKLANAICSILDDPNLARQLADQGRCTASHRFAPAPLAKQVESILDQVVRTAARRVA